jgi:hypothetical protein
MIFSNRQRRPDSSGVPGHRPPAERGAEFGQVLHPRRATRNVADDEPEQGHDLEKKFRKI